MIHSVLSDILLSFLALVVSSPNINRMIFLKNKSNHPISRFKSSSGFSHVQNKSHSLLGSARPYTSQPLPICNNLYPFPPQSPYLPNTRIIALPKICPILALHEKLFNLRLLNGSIHHFIQISTYGISLERFSLGNF